MCPIPNGFRDTTISLYSSKIVRKKKILRAVSSTGICCSSDKIGTQGISGFLDFIHRPVFEGTRRFLVLFTIITTLQKLFHKVGTV
jgi:hypothetical protein